MCMPLLFNLTWEDQGTQRKSRVVFSTACIARPKDMQPGPLDTQVPYKNLRYY